MENSIFCAVQSSNYKNDPLAVENIVKSYKDHPIVESIKRNITVSHDFSVEEASAEIIKVLKYRKATGQDKIPVEIAKISADI